MSPKPETPTANLLEMARFLALPGANRLIEAFAAIPPGPLRDSVITHAEVIAATYSAAPPDRRMPDPIALIGQQQTRSIKGTAAASRAGHAPTRTGQEPATESLESKIVKMRLAGKKPGEIAAKIKRHPSFVYSVLAEARKAGVPIPTRAKPGEVDHSGVRWIRTLAELEPQGLRLVEKAAAARNITPQAYMERRQTALRLAQAGAGWNQILQETGEASAKVVSAWLSNARAAGLDVPYVATEQEATIEEPAEAPQRPQEAPPAAEASDGTSAPQAQPSAQISELV